MENKEFQAKEEDRELQAKEVLNQAIEETISFSAKTKAPIADMIYSSDLSPEKPVTIYVLFEEVAQLQAMEEEHLKDEFMGTFLRALSSREYPFPESPQFRFEFSVES